MSVENKNIVCVKREDIGISLVDKIYHDANSRLLWGNGLSDRERMVLTDIRAVILRHDPSINPSNTEPDDIE